MTPDPRPLQKLDELFEEQPCWLIEPLAKQMGYSVPSVRRFLQRVGYFSSFTHNGKYYTLEDIPQFDRDGLWFWQQVGFSREGTLTATLIRVIDRSQAGLSAAELGELLGCRCHAILAKLWRTDRVRRHAVGRGHVYVSANATVAERQEQALSQRTVARRGLPAEVAVFALVEFIRNPSRNARELAEVLRRVRKVRVSPMQIGRLFKEHGLEKKLRTVAPGHCKR